MVRRGKIIALLTGVVLLFLITGCLYLVTQVHLPVSPSQPYFPAVSNRLPQLHWLFGQFQPVFLYPFAGADQIPNYAVVC